MPHQKMIATMNNRAVLALCQGHCMEAITLLRSTLECIQNLLDSIAWEKISCEVSLPLRSPIAFVENVDLNAVSPNNKFDVYTSAFFLPDITDDCITIEAVVITLYNLGLTHHLLGLRNNKTEHLQAALRYYKRALAAHASRSSNEYCQLSVVLGCITNMGHLYSHFSRIQEIESCCNMLETFLQSQQASTISEEDLDFFFSGMVFCQTFSCRMAAAA